MDFYNIRAWRNYFARASSPFRPPFLRATHRLSRVSYASRWRNYYVCHGDRLKESVLHKVCLWARRPYIVDWCLYSTSRRDLKSKFCIRHFEVNAEIYWRDGARKFASIHVQSFRFPFPPCFAILFLPSRSKLAQLSKQYVPRNKESLFEKIVCLISNQIPRLFLAQLTNTCETTVWIINERVWTSVLSTNIKYEVQNDLPIIIDLPFDSMRRSFIEL